MSVFSKVSPLGGAAAENRDNLAKYRNDQQHDLVVCPHLATPCFFFSPPSLLRPSVPVSGLHVETSDACQPCQCHQTEPASVLSPRITNLRQIKETYT